MAHRYEAIKVVQQPGAPAFFMTSVPAAELLEWCDVPRAKGDYMAGYQRVLDPRRTGDLTSYLRLSPNNIVPGAIIVAIDNDYVREEEVSSGLFAVSIEDDQRTFEEKLQELWGQFTTRLTDEELTSAGIDFGSPAATATGVSSGEATNGIDGQDVSADDIADFVDSPAESPEDVVLADDDAEDSGVFPTSYLASLAKELTTAVQNWDDLTPARQSAIRSYIDGVSKPGLIIDGQHRAFGAKDVSEHDVRLPVVLLPSLAFGEQVFQFYVLNSKARPLRPTELRRIVSTSLTNAEIEQLYERFKAAGIEAEEARWTLQMDTHPDSPFRGRIDFGFGQGGAIIPENVADQVVRAFMKMPKSRYKQLISPLGDRWDDVDKRLEIFFWFWNAIKEVYAAAWADAEARADGGDKAQLFMKVAMLTLQQFVLDRFVTALPYRGSNDDPPLSSQAEVENMVRSTLTNLPAEFFERDWKLKQIDTSEGRKQLLAFMDQVWNNQGKLHGNMALYRG